MGKLEKLFVVGLVIVLITAFLMRLHQFSNIYVNLSIVIIFLVCFIGIIIIPSVVYHKSKIEYKSYMNKLFGK